MYADNSKKQKLKRYGSTVIVSLFSVIGFISALYLVFIVVLIQGDKISKWIKDYLNSILQKKPNNSFIKLFLKNIDPILTKEYLFSYSKNILIAFGVSIFVSMLITSLILRANYKTIKGSDENKKSIKEQRTRSQVGISILIFSVSMMVVSLSIIISIYKIVNRDASQMMIDYLDKNIRNKKNNPFFEILKGIIRSTFKQDVDHDIVFQIRNEISTPMYVIFGISMFMFVISASYLLYDHFMSKSSGATIEEAESIESSNVELSSVLA